MSSPSSASSASSSLTGFVQLQGPITTTQLDNIKDNNYPFLISFAPRSTSPSLTGNRIDESTGVTGVTSITYIGHTFKLVDVQICSLIHTGYALPGNTNTPVSELILSFNLSNPSTISNSPSSPKAILVCIPIYNSSTASYSDYLTQIVKSDATQSTVSTLQSLFYASPTDTSKVSLSYHTTFYTVSSNSPQQPIPNNIYIVIFPTGITMTSSVYQVLLNRIGSTPLPSYQLPPAIRGGDSTVTSYNYNSNGRITVKNTSVNGNIPTMQVSTCTDNFTNNFVYYTQPPRIPSSSSSSSGTNNQCPYYQTTQYKCVPFNQLKDLSGQYVIPGGRTLNTLLEETQQVQVMQNNGNLVPNANGTLSTADIEGIVAGVAGGIIVLLGAVFIGSWISKNA